MSKRIFIFIFVIKNKLLTNQTFAILVNNIFFFFYKYINHQHIHEHHNKTLNHGTSAMICFIHLIVSALLEQHYFNNGSNINTNLFQHI